MMRAKIDAGIVIGLWPMMKTVTNHPIISFSSTVTMTVAAVGVAALTGVEVVENHFITSAITASAITVVALGGATAGGF